MNSTTVVAWWGATLSTLVFAWDIYKFRQTGPKLRSFVKGNMIAHNVPDYEGKTLVWVNVSNYGDRPTTITHFWFVYYTSRWQMLRDKRSKTAYVESPSPGQPPPFELKPGGIWIGMATQNAALEEWVRTGFLYVFIYHSHSEKPIRMRVLINNPAPEKF